MSIVNSIKKIAVKLDVAETPEKIYAPDIVTALKQVAVGYGVAEDPSGVSGSAIDEVLDVIAENITPGGGNPNSEEVITGTLAEPFGDHSVTELLSKVGTSASIKLELSFGGTTGSVLLDSNGEYLYGGYAAFDVSGGQGSVTTAFRLDYSERGIEVADALMSGTYTSLLSMAEQIPTTTTIIWHPMSK